MSTYIAPCRGCPLREGCDQRAEFSKRIAGLGLRSAKFNCDRLAAEMRPGRRIVTTTPKMEMHPNDYEPDYRTVQVAAPATIVAVHGYYQFSCVIDPGHVYPTIGDDDPKDIYRFRRYRPHTRIVRFLDESDAPRCDHARILRDGVCDRPPDTLCECKEWQDMS